MLNAYKAHGIVPDVIWMDAGWYTGADGESVAWSQTGSMDIDYTRFPDGMASIGEFAEKNDAMFLLWFEPENMRLDTEAFLAGQPVVVEEEAPAIAETPAAAPVAAAAEDDAMAYEEEAFNGVRRVIARQMHASLSEMAQLTLNASFDATALMNFRAMLKEKGEALGLGKISLNDMVLFAVSRTLLSHKTINANVVDDKFRYFRHANIGLAVDTERGLLVPTLFKAEELSLSAISAYAKSAAAKARDGKLTPDEMAGGSFTVTNLGSLGVESFTPVINPPQTAILGVCAITNRLRDDGTVYPAMGLSLTFDHRAVDGAPAARFLSDLCKALENFELLLAK